MTRPGKLRHYEGEDCRIEAVLCMENSGLGRANLAPLENGCSGMSLVDQVGPILEARLGSAMRSDFRAYVDELAELHPAGLVRNGELPRHTPGGYVPDDLKHINHETRLKFMERLAELLEERIVGGLN